MATLSRRAALIGSASIIALSVGVVAQEPLRRSKEIISFMKARASVEHIVAAEVIPAAEKTFGVKYSPQDVARINAHVWDKAHAILSEHYVPMEKP